MKDSTEKTTKATISKETSLEGYRKRADILTKAYQSSERTPREDVEKHLKSGNSSLSQADAEVVLDALKKGAKISSEGTISLVGDPRRWGGMSGEGSSETYEQRIIRHEKR